MHGWIIERPQASGLNVNVARGCIPPPLSWTSILIGPFARCSQRDLDSKLSGIVASLYSNTGGEPTVWIHWIVSEMYEWRPMRRYRAISKLSFLRSTTYGCLGYKHLSMCGPRIWATHDQPSSSAVLSFPLSPLKMCNLGLKSLSHDHQLWCSSNCQSSPASLHKQMATQNTFIQRSHTQGQWQA